MIATIVFTLCRCGVKKRVKLQYWNLTHRKFPGEFYTLMFFDTMFNVCMFEVQLMIFFPKFQCF